MLWRKYRDKTVPEEGERVKSKNRMIRINDEILKEAANIIRAELKDPRMPKETLCSVTRADTTNDLKYCKIYVSVLGDDTQKKEVLEALKNASGFIRHEIAERINLRNTPELKFILDDSMEYSAKIEKLIDQVKDW